MQTVGRRQACEEDNEMLSKQYFALARVSTRKERRMWQESKQDLAWWKITYPNNNSDLALYKEKPISIYVQGGDY